MNTGFSGGRMARAVLAMLLAAACLAAPHTAQGGDFDSCRDWLDKSVIIQNDHIYAVGHSQLCKTEAEAKEEALAAATKEFIRYCRVSVDSFDRSIEVYSAVNGRVGRSSDLVSQSTVRSKAFVSRAVPEDWHIAGANGGIVASVLLKVPKSEYDRIASENNIKISLDVLFYCEDDDARMKVFSEGDVLKSGQGYALYLKPSDTCCIYVYQIDHLGKSFRLFPNADYKTASNPVSAGSDLWIPNKDDLFTLDETTGKEFFYIFASPDPLKEFEGGKGASLERKDIDNIVSLKKMGLAGVKKKIGSVRVTPPNSRSRYDVLEVKKKLQAEGAFVYETWFWHN